MTPWPPEELALLTDLYQLTMAQAYVQAGKAHEMATFSLFVRTYPPHRGYFVACGLADVVRYLERWRFSTTRLLRGGHTVVYDLDADAITQSTHEGHAVETLQAGLWGLSAVVALLAIARQPASADRGFAAWMAAVGLLALWRELDLHVVLNQLFHVRFKSLWLLDPTVPWWHKMTWVGLGIGLATALAAPLWRQRRSLMALLRGPSARSADRPMRWA